MLVSGGLALVLFATQACPRRLRREADQLNCVGVERVKPWMVRPANESDCTVLS